MCVGVIYLLIYIIVDLVAALLVTISERIMGWLSWGREHSSVEESLLRAHNAKAPSSVLKA